MKVKVLSGYQTKFGELWHMSLEDLMLEASQQAVTMAKINPKDIDLVVVANKIGDKNSNQNHLGALLISSLKINCPAFRVEAACASGGVAVNQAYTALRSKQYQTALVVGVEKMTDLSSAQTSKALMKAASKQERLSGASFVGLYGLTAQRYLTKFKLNSSDLAHTAIKNHYHGSLNSKAQFPFEISQEKHQKSPIIASPLRLLDCSPISDGAAALVLKSSQSLKKNEVEIKASSLATDQVNISKRSSLTEIKSTQSAFKKALLQAKLKPKDIDFLEVHDCFTISEILALEDMGFYKKGQGWQAAKLKHSYKDGQLPVNLSGGLKACGHPVGATGVKQVVEVFCQLSGQAGKRQLKDARIGLTHNLGGTGGTAVIHILERCQP